MQHEQLSVLRDAGANIVYSFAVCAYTQRNRGTDFSLGVAIAPPCRSRNITFLFGQTPSENLIQGLRGEAVPGDATPMVETKKKNS